MNAIRLLRQLETYPLFTESDVAKVVNKTPAYVRTLMHRLFKRGLIMRIARGRYTLYQDPFVFASHLVTPSYIGLWSAMRFYQMTRQQPFDVFVLSPISHKEIRLPHGRIFFKKTRHMFGYSKVRHDDFDIFISDKEKTIIDALLFRLPIYDIREALQDVEPQKLADYARRTHNVSMMKRLGYLLEHTFGDSYGLRAFDNNYIPLSRRKRGQKDRRWKLIL